MVVCRWLVVMIWVWVGLNLLIDMVLCCFFLNSSGVIILIYVLIGFCLRIVGVVLVKCF